MLITATEIDDFREIIRDAGQDPADFDLAEEKTHLPQPAKASDAVRAVVTCRRTGKRRIYNALHWVVDFADDIRDGAFD